MKRVKHIVVASLLAGALLFSLGAHAAAKTNPR